jgi:hypothetical protein
MPRLLHLNLWHRAFPAWGVVSAMLLGACNGSGSDIRFPSDTAISRALSVNFAEDPDNAKARELIGVLGGEAGQLDYRIKRVIWRQGAFVAQYDVNLRMGQAGQVSLQKLYATMIPKEEAAKLPQQSLQAYENWLANHAAALEKSNAQQAAALRASLESLGKCYRDVKAGDRVALLSGLAALISPERGGWYAERLRSADAQLGCLPL